MQGLLLIALLTFGHSMQECFGNSYEEAYEAHVDEKNHLHKRQGNCKELFMSKFWKNWLTFDIYLSESGLWE